MLPPAGAVPLAMELEDEFESDTQFGLARLGLGPTSQPACQKYLRKTREVLKENPNVMELAGALLEIIRERVIDFDDIDLEGL